MRIGLDAKRFFHNRSGLGNYSRNLVYSLAEFHKENTYVLFTPSVNPGFLNDRQGGLEVVTPRQPLHRWFPSAWRARWICSSIRDSKLDIYHGLSHELPRGVERLPVKTVLTVHDLIFIRFPELYSPIDAYIYRQKLIYSCRVASQIVAISQQTKADLVHYLNVNPQKINVIYQGCSPAFWQKHSPEHIQAVRAKYNLPDKYLLYVGTIEPRKNLLTVIRALHEGGINARLVAVGRKTDYFHRKVLPYVNENGLGSIHFPEGVTNDDLPAMYQGAECFIYPSIFEGFGIPILEALVSGVPVITSRNGCFPEAGGPESIYVEPTSPGEIADAIQRVVANPELRASMAEAGRLHARQFSDNAIANQYAGLYKSLL